MSKKDNIGGDIIAILKEDSYEDVVGFDKERELEKLHANDNSSETPFKKFIKGYIKDLWELNTDEEVTDKFINELANELEDDDNFWNMIDDYILNTDLESKPKNMTENKKER